MNAKRKTKGSIPPPPLGRKKVGRYNIIYPIAQGGMASVYAGLLPGMAGFEKLVAIKIIHPHLASDSKFVDMFLDEARLAAQIHHPNVGEIYEVGEDDNLLFMVGELINGQSLSKFFRRAKALGTGISQPVAADIVAKVCLGLHAAHELKGQDGKNLNLVHRDVTPRNILNSYDGFIKLIDFGVAWAQTRSSHTAEGIVKGKIGFMSPEQLHGKRLDRRSDIFALGVVLYLAVTGILPFSGRSDLVRINKMLQGDFPKPRQVNANVSPRLEQIILTAMSTNREGRFNTAAEMGQALDDYTRRSDEEVGSAAISRIMHRLFIEEFNAHQEKLRHWRKQSDQGQSAFPSLSMESDSSASQPGLSQSTRGTSVAMMKRFLFRSKWRVVIGAMLTLALVTSTVVIFAFGEPETVAITEELTGSEDDVVVVDAAPSAVETVAVEAADESEEERAAEELPTDTPSAVEDEQPVREESQSYLVTFDLVPASTSVIFDSHFLGPGVREFRVPDDERPHTVTLSAQGYESQTKTITVTGDTVLTVELDRVKAKALKPRPRKKKRKRKSNLSLKSSPYD